MQATPPHDQIPAILPVDLTIGQTENSFVTLSEVHAFSQGCLLHILAGARRPSGSDALWDHPEYGLRIFSRQPGHEDELLIVEVQLPDGATASNHDTDTQTGLYVANIEGRAQSDPDATQLTYRQPVWVSPVPETGKLALTVHWPAYGISSATINLDCAELAHAARSARPIWPNS